ncbi:hypothetical protein SCYAM73S_08173 [Streptomyces cyaneofuscatus]
MKPRSTAASRRSAYSTAWAAGFDGTGTKVAVLDTGIDTGHPDLAGKVAAEQDFSGAGSPGDKFGDGTHVASTVAGSGAKSGGKYKGVAPGARLLNGKVLDDWGEGSDSGIIAGMEWAVAQGADVVNLSLGGTDLPGIDPLEETVNRLSAESDTLFVIAAGNEGLGERTVGSPGSAASALTVGAVDKSDVLADFSSRGPRVGDSGVKPDLTAPGVAITAASAAGSVLAEHYPSDIPGYLTIDGTSMATPHVAGAAAILAQQHPDWSGERIKAVLTGSTKPGAYSSFQQGTGTGRPGPRPEGERRHRAGPARLRRPAVAARRRQGADQAAHLPQSRYRAGHPRPGGGRLRGGPEARRRGHVHRLPAAALPSRRAARRAPR